MSFVILKLFVTDSYLGRLLINFMIKSCILNKGFYLEKAVISSILLLATSSFASTTMCFKESHSSMATIESIALDGGECAGKYSINDMKAKGWNVDDIKISQTPKGMSFIYILKSPNHSKVAPMVAGGAVGGAAISQEQMEANIMAKLEAKKLPKKKQKLSKKLKKQKLMLKEFIQINVKIVMVQKVKLEKVIQDLMS